MGYNNKHSGNEFEGYDSGVITMANILQKTLDFMGGIFDKIDEKPKDTAFIRSFCQMRSSIVIIIRPKELETRTGSRFKVELSGDDFIIIEYNKNVDRVVQAIAAKLDHQLRTMVDNSNGLLVVEE